MGTNITTTCAKRLTYKVTVADGMYMTKCEFTQDNVKISMIDNNYNFQEVDHFTPTRDTSKEQNGIVLYLYNASERQNYGADLNYCAVKNVNGTDRVYWYLYDEDEDGNDYTFEGIYPDYMPVISSENRARLNRIYN